MRKLTFGLALLLPFACGKPATVGNAILVTVNWDAALQPTQLVFSTSSGAFDTTSLPNPPASSSLPSGSSAQFGVKATALGTAFVVHVDGKANGVIIGSGDSVPVTVQSGAQAQITVTLLPPGASDGGSDGGVPDAGTHDGGNGPDGGAPDSGTPDSGSGDGGFDAGCVNCAGCCTAGGACSNPSTTTCGVDGGLCEACGGAADNCSMSGTCACGMGPPCSGTSNVCTSGVCKCGATPACATGEQCNGFGVCECGSGPACAAGLECVAGGCQCTKNSCAGCCNPDGGAECFSGMTDPTACGVGGEACQTCANPSCDGGVCAGCGPANCLTCCFSGSCQPISQGVVCGANGGTCNLCDQNLANSCVSGKCSCGNLGAECAPGQLCMSGTCVCNSASCPNGCCTGPNCQSPSKASCGIDGGACVACGTLTADHCANGQCMCGSGKACNSGQECLAGACVCDSTSCPTGCCDANKQCQPGSQDSACGSGAGACIACPTNATCQSQSCICGGSVCNPPRHCNCLLGCGCN